MGNVLVLVLWVRLCWTVWSGWVLGCWWGRGWRGDVALVLWVSDVVMVHVLVEVWVQVCCFGGCAIWYVADCMGVIVFRVGGVQCVECFCFGDVCDAV